MHRPLPYELGKEDLRLNIPALSGHALVAAQTPLRIVLSCLEQLSSLGGILFHHRSETNLALQIILELAPIRLLAVERERVLALSLQSRIVTPQVPVATLNGSLLLSLRLTHTFLQTVVDTGSISDNQ